MRRIIYLVFIFNSIFFACYNDKQHLMFEDSKLFDLEKALIEAKNEEKELLIYFNAYGCVNCRKMEEGILSESAIQKMIKEKYKFIVLYVDDKSKIENTEKKNVTVD